MEIWSQITKTVGHHIDIKTDSQPNLNLEPVFILLPIFNMCKICQSNYAVQLVHKSVCVLKSGLHSLASKKINSLPQCFKSGTPNFLAQGTAKANHN